VIRCTRSREWSGSEVDDVDIPNIVGIGGASLFTFLIGEIIRMDGASCFSLVILKIVRIDGASLGWFLLSKTWH
jgi:hypothetical protein